MEPKDKITDIESLYDSYLSCTKGLRHKDTVIWAKHNIMERVYYLYSSIVNGTYRIARYNQVRITFPKQRVALATSLKDRAFQRSLVDNYFYNELTRHFIHENCACLKGKGTDYARGLFKKQLISAKVKYGTTDVYALKCDVHHFFESIDHKIMEKLLGKYIRDPWVRSEAMRVVNSFDHGLGLGSQISQLTASAYLSPFDHFVKEKLKIKYYVRYMDDFILMHNDKKYLKHCLDEITRFLASISLRLNEKKTQIFALRSQKVTFLGFKYGYTHSGRTLMILPKTNAYIERRRLRHQIAFYKRKGVLTYDKMWDAYVSWENHANKGDNHKVISDMRKFFDALCDEYSLNVKGENMEKYFCYRHYRGTDICGSRPVNIHFGTDVSSVNGLICSHDVIICKADSAEGHQYFCYGADGFGKERGDLIKKISLSLSIRYKNALTKDSPKCAYRWNKTVERIFGSDVSRKYLKSDVGVYWNDAYYRAPLEDLREIATIIGLRPSSFQ